MNWIEKLKGNGSVVAALSVALFLAGEPTAAQRTPAIEPDWNADQAEQELHSGNAEAEVGAQDPVQEPQAFRIQDIPEPPFRGFVFPHESVPRVMDKAGYQERVKFYLAEAERKFNSGNAAAAVGALDLVLKLQAEHALEIPESFWFLRAQAARAEGLYGSVIDSATRYMQIAGQQSEHYVAALALVEWAEEASAARGLQPGTAFSDALSSGGRGPEMVLIPAGRFRMGCVSGQDCFPLELPVREVTIREAFAVAKNEVTFEQWDACVADGGCGGYLPDDLGWGRGDHPVILVSWDDAQAYVLWLSRQSGHSYRLLSEAEWEYVARAGAETAFSWGNNMEQNRANCEEPSHITLWSICADGWMNTSPVGSFTANAFGVNDMHGNVGEWVEDCWNDSYVGAPSDGNAWRNGNCSRPVYRGGSWEDYATLVRSAMRSRATAERRLNNVGFRVARTLAP